MREKPETAEESPLAEAAATSAEATPSAPEDEAEELVETAHVPEKENSKENEPMLDVHMPHPTHTWKDFFIHLGTITAGLLIAISLEQSVEALHHLHQRHELEASLRKECEVNKERAEDDFIRYDEQMTWLLGLHEDIATMRATGGRANLPYRPMQFRPLVLEGVPYTAGAGMALLSAVFDTASADNRLALLPDDLDRSYSRLYRVQEARFGELRNRAVDAGARQAAFEALYADGRTPTTPVLARMSAADLKEYDALVMQTFTALRFAKTQLVTVYGTNNGMRQGLNDPASLHRLDDEAKAAYRDDYGKMADEIAAEDAARDKAAANPSEKGAR